ncbi:MAG: hypothetical protein K5770_06300 [Lachnospiraceae bacterium]|nr:hypothetical protein [Lachnospiraceae bacterium]
MTGLDKTIKELKEQKARINMMLETEEQLSAIMGAVMQDEEACKLLHDLTPEEAAVLAKPFIQNLPQMIRVTTSDRAKIKS